MILSLSLSLMLLGEPTPLVARPPLGLADYEACAGRLMADAEAAAEKPEPATYLFWNLRLAAALLAHGLSAAEINARMEALRVEKAKATPAEAGVDRVNCRMLTPSHVRAADKPAP